MARDITITLQGIVGTVPTLMHTGTGKAYCHFRVAATPGFMTREGWRNQETVWFSVKAWGQLAENFCYSFRKGEPVFISGRLTQESWTRQDTGEKGSSHVITAMTGGHDLTRGQTRFARTSGAMERASASSAQSAASAHSGNSGATSSSASSADSAGSSQDAGSTLPQDHWEVAEPAGECEEYVNEDGEIIAGPASCLGEENAEESAAGSERGSTDPGYVVVED